MSSFAFLQAGICTFCLADVDFEAYDTGVLDRFVGGVATRSPLSVVVEPREVGELEAFLVTDRAISLFSSKNAAICS